MTQPNDLQGEVFALREELNAFKKEWGVAKQNLLWPTLIRPGTLRFGGNAMELGKHGAQVQAPGPSVQYAIFFLEDLQANPLTAIFADGIPGGFLGGAFTSTAGQLFLGAAYNLTGSQLTLAVDKSDATNTYSKFEGGTLLLPSSDADFASLAQADGAIQYRTDTDKIRARINGATQNLATEAYADVHPADTSDAHDASAISVDSTNLVGVATDVQASLEELDNGIADHLADTSDAHDASSISVLDSGARFTGTDVETVLAEIFDAIPAGGGGMSLIVKEADQTINTDNSINNDNELLFAVAANEVFQFEGVLMVSAANATMDIKISFTGPAGAVGSFFAIAADTATGSIDASSAALGTEVPLISTVAITGVRFWGGIHNGGTAGNLTLQWSQNTSDGGNLTVRAGSYLKFQLES